VVLTDAEGRIVLFNRFAEQTTGCFRQSVIGRNIVTFIPETWKPIVLKRFADPSAAEVRAPHQNPWLDQTGKEHMIEWRCTPFSRPGSDKPWILGVGIPVEGTDLPERFTRITLN
jgi:PAS domain S-box-containing protein